ncbi:splicing factor PWI domain-containing protein [Iris pallida]|uniref:Splicing factor PWI domain-containing protein n=1 Tax=Iris pallida TaxID=29817 RepID=A0AAX6GWP1_IRIPA|nr:splicing factor PWI domain-containing protein [Iris pallida]
MATPVREQQTTRQPPRVRPAAARTELQHLHKRRPCAARPGWPAPGSATRPFPLRFRFGGPTPVPPRASSAAPGVDSPTLRDEPSPQAPSSRFPEPFSMLCGDCSCRCILRRLLSCTSAMARNPHDL